MWVETHEKDVYIYNIHNGMNPEIVYLKENQLYNLISDSV